MTTNCQPKKILNLNTHVSFILAATANKFSSGHSRAFLDQYGIGRNEWRVLAILAIHPDVSANDICEITGMDKAAVSRSAKALLQRGYIRSVKKKGGGRKRALSLTDDGCELHNEILDMALEREQKLLEGFTPVETDTLIGFLKRLHANAISANAELGLTAASDAAD